MSNGKKQVPPTNPFLKLNEDAIKHLDSIGEEIKAGRAIIDDLEGLGIDQSRLRQTLDWAEGVRDVLMKHSTPAKEQK